VKYSKKGSSFFYMASREVEIHRGRLDNEILADRAQLLTQFLSKNIFKIFGKYRKMFSFFLDGNFENFRKISMFFIIFEGSETKKSRFSENFQNVNPKK